MEAIRLAPRTDARPDLDYEAPDWYVDARCLDADPDVFFPEGKGTSPEPAVAVCRGCPVLYDCLIYAMGDDQLVGVWGGTTDKERKALRQKSGLSQSEATLETISADDLC